ncbi:photosynthetic complex assembly protein PuhC [Rubrivivax sp. RP6-9]|uniref:photosynthetic complex assembly protein PuhC n=1 Tax=Rubrivivax sp. RP6-9 TaxID=3415750 RepID=UPI003CC53C7E
MRSTLPAPRQPDALPRGAVVAIGAVLLAVLAGVAGVRSAGVTIRAPDAPAIAKRQLRFEDRPDGSVAVIDARSGQQIEAVQGEAGFLRGALRALARERQKRDLGAGPAFELIARADGRLTLADPATGERLDLESFGPTNAAVFARLLQAGHPAGTTR